MTLSIRPTVAGIGTATPDTAYTQAQILDLFDIKDRRTALLFRNGGIDRRFLSLALDPVSGKPREETQGELLQKHERFALEVGSSAIERCLRRANASLGDVRYLCCVTTTGMLTPGLSALLCERLQLRRDCSRLDIVGMGCNAGLNGLNAVASWARSNPGKLALMLCAEICSAAYVMDDRVETAVVNGLFGDGAGAIALIAPEDGQSTNPSILSFTSRVVTEAIDAMRFDWSEEHGKFSFALALDTPYVVGANVESVIDQLLGEAGLRRSDIAHWIVHSGGKKVIDAVRINLGLTGTDLRHTAGVLRDFGNVSSGSFLFSLERLLDEGIARRGDYGVMMTMGPGTTIETALMQW